MRVLAVLLGLIVVASAVMEEEAAEGEWQKFKLTFGKQYADEAEELMRKQIFMEAKLRIEKHNQDYQQGLVTFSKGINQFSDLRHEEFASMYLSGVSRSLKDKYDDAIKAAVHFISPPNIELPKYMDWRNHGAVTPVKDQGDSCVSLWAFSAIGALEAQNFFFTKKLISLSEQQLVDCLPEKNETHCTDTFSILAFQYIKQNGGIQSESSYKYTAKDDSTCKFDKRKIQTSIHAFGKINPVDEKTLMEAVAIVGPISIEIFVKNDIKEYKGDVLTAPCNTGYTLPVLLVGYGTQNGSDYWLLKNSLGTTWGEEGYMKIDRRKSEHCYLFKQPVYPLV